MLSIWRSVGRRGENKANDVMHVQLLLNTAYKKLWVQSIASWFFPWQPETWAPGIWLVPDGDCGKKTVQAIEEFQRHVVKLSAPDGKVDPGGKTFQQLVSSATFMAPPNLTAQFEDVRLASARSQAMVGRITVNTNTYFFNTGGHGRGNLPPGAYTIRTQDYTPNRSGSYSFAGVGFSFGLNSKTNQTRDPRLEKDFKDFDPRTDLLIHPDGGVPGTLGCLGLLGGTETLRGFRDDMLAELKRNSDQVTLNVLKLN
jgi:peptidoglycan hydrolase-like protein with peptidoglycan-binding domain